MMFRISTIAVLIFLLPSVIFAASKDSLLITRTENFVMINIKDSLNGISLAIADLGTDGIPEFVVGNGQGLEPRVRVFRQDGTEIGGFLAYAPTMKQGVNVVVCDLDGDGVNEIVTSAQRGGGPHVRVFTNEGVAMGSGVFVYEKGFRGGVNMACGDLTADGKAELVTMPAAGGHPDVRVWNLSENGLMQTDGQFIFDASQIFGLVGAIVDQKLFISEQKTKSPRVKTFVVKNKKLKEKNSTQTNVVTTGIASIVIHNNETLLSTTSDGLFYRVSDGKKEKISDDGQSFVFVSADTDQDETKELIAVSARPSFDETNETKIIVNISEQRLYAFSNGILDNSFLISSGKYNATPLGNHSILAKIPFVHYRWSYGENDPRNYDLGRVPFNLRFAPHIYLHYAYWHNNFGHPMSRGCVNVGLENMKWLYAWAIEGVPVQVVE